MVAYSFKRQFVDAIRTGNKRQTIRSDRKRHARPGEQVQLYTGMRTKSCRLVGTATCESVSPITLDFTAPSVTIGGVHRVDPETFAVRDGFTCWEQLRNFWEENHGGCSSWSGIRITWKDLVPA